MRNMNESMIWLHPLTSELNQTQPFPDAIIVRQELLVSTPGSNFPVQNQQTRRRWLKPLQVVEHVDVQQDSLEEFRNIMIHGNGPAMNFILSERKWCQFRREHGSSETDSDDAVQKCQFTAVEDDAIGIPNPAWDNCCNNHVNDCRLQPDKPNNNIGVSRPAFLATQGDQNDSASWQK